MGKKDTLTKDLYEEYTSIRRCIQSFNLSGKKEK